MSLRDENWSWGVSCLTSNRRSINPVEQGTASLPPNTAHIQLSQESAFPLSHTVKTLESTPHLSCSNLCPSRQISLVLFTKNALGYSRFRPSVVFGRRRVSTPYATTVESFAFDAVASLGNTENHVRKACHNASCSPQAGEDYEKK